MSLAAATGLENPTPEQLARLDRKRRKKTSNKHRRSPADSDAHRKDERRPHAPGPQG